MVACTSPTGMRTRRWTARSSGIGSPAGLALRAPPKCRGGTAASAIIAVGPRLEAPEEVSDAVDAERKVTSGTAAAAAMVWPLSVSANLAALPC